MTAQNKHIILHSSVCAGKSDGVFTGSRSHGACWLRRSIRSRERRRLSVRWRSWGGSATARSAARGRPCPGCSLQKGELCFSSLTFAQVTDSSNVKPSEYSKHGCRLTSLHFDHLTHKTKMLVCNGQRQKPRLNVWPLSPQEARANIFTDTRSWKRFGKTIIM